MKKLITLLLIACCFTNAIGVTEEEQLEQRADLLINSYASVAYTTNEALKSIFKIAVVELRHRKDKELADKIEREWRQFDGYLIDIVVMNRDIGWFKPLVEWLAITYEAIEASIGYEAARALRISDIKTINHAIVVVFRPCYFGFPEFEKHFVHDSRYRGLAPVITYWSTALACTAALHGAGYFFVCSPTAVLIERIVDKRVAPRLAPKLYNLACTL